MKREKARLMANYIVLLMLTAILTSILVPSPLLKTTVKTMVADTLLAPSPPPETTEKTKHEESLQKTETDNKTEEKEKTIGEKLAEMSPSTWFATSFFDDEGVESIEILISPKEFLSDNVVLLMRKKGGYQIYYVSKEGEMKVRLGFGFSNHKFIFKEWLEQEAFEALVERLVNMGVEFLD